MIKKIDITNFKGVKDNVSIDLKPITLLFGPNSVGKSTILHALFLFREILQTRECDVAKFSFGEDSIDIGGFKNYIYNHLYEELETSIKVDFELPDDGLIEYSHYDEWDDPQLNFYFEKYQEIGSLFPNLALEIKIGWIKDELKPGVKSLSVYSGEEILTQIRYHSLTNYAFYINVNNSLLLDSFPEEMPQISSSLDLEIPDNGVVMKGVVNPFVKIPNGIPEWGKAIHKLDFFNEENIESNKDIQFILNSLSDMTVSAGELLLDELNKMVYIGPLRKLPDRNFIARNKNENERWFSGLAAWDVLYQNPELIPSINNWLKKLKIEYKLELVEYREVPTNIFSTKDSDNRIDLINEIQSLISERTDEFNNIQSDIETRMQKMFGEIRGIMAANYKKIYEPSQELKKIVPSIAAAGIGASIGTLFGGPLGAAAGMAVGGLIGQFKNKKISSDELEDKLKKELETTLQTEKEKIFNLIDQIEDRNDETERKITSMISEFRNEVQERLLANIEMFQSQVETINDKLIKIQSINDQLKTEQSLRSEIYKYPVMKRLYIIDRNTGVKLLPYDIGVGISQILPIVVAVINQKSSILAIEQPELHNHPAIQVELADLLIYEVNRKPDFLYLIETHSEHMLLRLLKRIRKSNEVEENLQLKSDNLGVYFVEIFDESVLITPQEIKADGRFSNRWPNGFFEERKKELF